MLDSKKQKQLNGHQSWPMFPQLFIDGEFIGGSHIMIEMYQSGNLQKIIHNQNL